MSSGKRVLVVGDGGALSGELERAGYDVARCASSREALAALSVSPPALLILDADAAGDAELRRAARSLPVVSADTTVAAIRQLLAPDLADPVPFVTANLQRMGESLPDLLARCREWARETGQLAALEPVLEEARLGGERIAAYVPYLKTFGDGAPATDRAPVDVREVLNFVVEIALSEIRPRATVHKRFHAAPPVMANERMLGQVFSSLIINAAQAIEPGRPDHNRIEVRTATTVEKWAMIEIEDTGAGIPAELLPRIFEPFFSTKRGAGMGLGLFLCHATIVGLGGSLAVESTLGSGSLFRILLPPA